MSLTAEKINQYSRDIYAQNCAVGWWDNPDRCLYECLQLISTEVAEATEGERKNLMDDHLPHRKMGEVELADALIRTLDLGGKTGIPFEDRLKHEKIPDDWSVAKRHLEINCAIVALAHNLAHSGKLIGSYSVLINTITQVSESLGYDIEAAMIEKLEYNKHRADHKRENRATENGKKF